MTTPQKNRHQSRAFELVYEDADLIVVNKAPGVLTVPTPKRERFTLVDEVSRHWSKSKTIHKTVVVVHRLDRDTSGLVVFAKHRAVRDRLMANWSAHTRIYDAAVKGVVLKDSGTIESRLITHQKSLTRRSLRDDEIVDDDDGEAAITHFRVARRGNNASLLAVQLDTGRRNQIRVHLAEAGHPILGDDRYGQATAPGWDPKRLGLHARVLGFPHPNSGKPLLFDTGLPGSFERFFSSAKATPST